MEAILYSQLKIMMFIIVKLQYMVGNYLMMDFAQNIACFVIQIKFV